jgi:hypothetical protein
MAKGLESEICIYCQKRLSTRKGDHVPPQCFFVDSRGFNLIQVPCCKKCNVKFSKDDELVRDLLSAEIRNENHPTIKGHLSGKRNRSWDRTPTKLLKILGNSKPITIGTANGEPIDSLAMDLNRPEVDRFLCRVGRAILYNDYKLLIKKEDCHWQLAENIRPEGQDQIRSILSNGAPHEYGDGDFRYRAVHVQNSAQGIILVQFYKGTEFVITFYKASKGCAWALIHFPSIIRNRLRLNWSGKT